MHKAYRHGVAFLCQQVFNFRLCMGYPRSRRSRDEFSLPCSCSALMDEFPSTKRITVTAVHGGDKLAVFYKQVPCHAHAVKGTVARLRRSYSLYTQ